MRRTSPPRFTRRNSPPRRGGRPRTLSPLSRSQPAPPGEERGRKTTPWDVQNSHKRPRSRSRSRERVGRGREADRDRLRGRLDREPPVISMVEEEQLRRRFDRERDPPRDNLQKEPGRLRERSRERHRDRDRAFHSSRIGENKDEKSRHHHKRHSLERRDGFEESYLDHQKNNFDNTRLHSNHEEQILDSSLISFGAYPPDNIGENARDIRPPSVRPSPNNSFANHENPEDRINRLEKLVEKLVEGNVKSPKLKDSSYSQLKKDIISELIPSNTKFTTSMWINRIHEECLHRNYDERSSIRYMQDKMTGIMKAWFKSVSNYDFTWPELKLLITKTFPDNIDFAQTLKLLVARDKTSDETITQYYFSKVYLCEACKITGENAVSCLVDGLSNPFMKQDIKSYNFLTPEALYSEYLSKFPEHELPVRSEHREVRVELRDETEYHNEDFIPLEVGSRDREHRISAPATSVRGERFADRLAEPPSERPKCFTCKKYGHLAVDCRHAPICYNCKKKGHIAAKCHFNNVLLISSVGMVLHNISVVNCKVKGKEFDGIIDTGSMKVTMKEGLAHELRLNLKETNEILKGFGGSVVKALGEAYVSLMVNSTQRLVKVLVVNDNVQDYALIVGQEFLSKNGVAVFINDGNVKVIDTDFNVVEK